MVRDLRIGKNIFERLENFFVENCRALGVVDKIFHALNNFWRHMNQIGMNISSAIAEKTYRSNFRVDITLSERRLLIKNFLKITHKARIKIFVGNFVAVGKSFLQNVAAFKG